MEIFTKIGKKFIEFDGHRDSFQTKATCVCVCIECLNWCWFFFSSFICWCMSSLLSLSFVSHPVWFSVVWHTSVFALKERQKKNQFKNWLWEGEHKSRKLINGVPFSRSVDPKHWTNEQTEIRRQKTMDTYVFLFRFFFFGKLNNNRETNHV